MESYCANHTNKIFASFQTKAEGFVIIDFRWHKNILCHYTDKKKVSVLEEDSFYPKVSYFHTVFRFL